MITINTRFTQFVWYGPDTPIANIPVANRFNLLRAITNNAGSAFSSYKTGRGVNSLTTIKTGAVLALESNGITPGTASTYYQIDNGVATSGITPPSYTFPFNFDTTDSLTTEIADYPAFNMKFSFTSTLPTGFTIGYKLNDGSVLSESQLNAAIIALDSPTINQNAYSVKFVITKTAEATGTVSITAAFVSL